MEKGKEEDKNIQVEKKEESDDSQPSVFGHLQFLLECLNNNEALPPNEIEETIESVVELLNKPNTPSFRKDFINLSCALASAVVKANPECALIYFAEITKKAANKIQTSTCAYRYAIFAANTALNIKLYTKSPKQATEEKKEEKKPKLTPEVKEERRQLKREQWKAMLAAVELILTKVSYFDSHMLQKLAKVLKEFVKRAGLINDPSLFKSDAKEDLLKLFICGSAAFKNMEMRAEIFKKFVGSLMVEGNLKNTPDILKYYMPILESITEEEIEGILAPQLLLLLKRSKESFQYVAPILQSFGKISCKSLALLIKTTLNELISQESSTAELQNLLLETLSNLSGKISDEKNFKEIIDSISVPWKAQLAITEVEAQKQKNFLKILLGFLKCSKLADIDSKKAFLCMNIELFAAIKHDKTAKEASVLIGEGLQEAFIKEGSLRQVFYERCAVCIFPKILSAQKSKDLASAFMHPIIAIGAELLEDKKDELARFLPDLTQAAWKEQVGLLNLNAVTQATFNVAVLSLNFLLIQRDQLQSKVKEEEKLDNYPVLKYLTNSQSTINKKEFIVQNEANQLESMLHINIIRILAQTSLAYIETQMQNILPIMANNLLQYCFSKICAVRKAACFAIMTIFNSFSKISKPDFATAFATFFQLAIFAFGKLSGVQEEKYTPYYKGVIVLLIKMIKELNQNKKDIDSFFWRLFILMHSSKANGKGKNNRNLCDKLWIKLKKLPIDTKARLETGSSFLLTYMCSGKSIFGEDGALISSDQVQTVINIIGTLIKEGLGPIITKACSKLFNKDVLYAAEKLQATIEAGEMETTSHFEIEFLVEEIQDLKALSAGIVKPREEKTTKPVKKPKESKKGAGKTTKPEKKEEGLSKEALLVENKKIFSSYAKEVITRVRTEIKNAMKILRALTKIWSTKELVKEVIKCGILDELKEIIKVPSVRFDAYLTLHSFLSCYKHVSYISRECDLIAECLFAAVIRSTDRKYIKCSTTLFTSLADCKIDLLDENIILIILDIAEYIIESNAISFTIKSKAVEVIIRVMQEGSYSVSVIHRITPIMVRILLSSYLAENMERLVHVFFANALYNDMFDLIRNTCNYDLMHQIALMKGIFAIKRALPQSPWICNVFLLHLFSENKDISTLAKACVNERTICFQDVLMVTEEQQKDPSNLVKLLNFPAKDVRDSAVRAIAGYLEICSHDMSTAVKLITQEYSRLEPRCQDTIANLFFATSSIIPSEDLRTTFHFLLTKGVATANSSAKDFMESGIKIIQEQGKKNAGLIIAAIEELISQGKKILTDNANTIAAIFIGYVARYLDKSDPKLPQLFKTLQGMLVIPADTVRISTAKCLGFFTSVFRDEAKSKLNAILSAMQKTEDKKIEAANEMKTQAYALAGCIKGLGITAMEEFKVMEILELPFKEKPSDNVLNIAKREWSLYAYTALSSTLGRSFEYYVEKCMLHILQSYSAGKEVVRLAAQQASKAIISKLTGQGVKCILPTLVKELESNNWRSKLAAVECLGTMAFMAPKQLSNYLPKIVSNIKIVLNDTQPKVHEAGIRALTAIGSVIKNPEIADISGKIIQALKNPTKDLIFALDLLLMQSFAHAIDAPSLSLIIPILDYGLRAQNNEVKKKATQLVSSICKLIGDPNDMLPYLPVVMPALKSALFDPIPEVRTAAAKALGSLCKGLGLENMQDIITWLKSIIQKEGSPAERSGAAQGYAEIIVAQGTEYLESLMEELIENTRSPSAAIREGYIGILLFLPISFGDGFEKYFTLVLPVVLEALTDTEEAVRNSANRVVQICIRQYGKKRTDVLLDPLMQRMLDTKYKIRENAVNLMGELLVVLETDITSEDPKFITVKEKNRILSTVFILKYDSVDSIRVAAAQIWKGFVDNQPKTLKIIMPSLIREILELVSKRSLDLREMGIFTLRDLAEKYSEKLTIDILALFKQRLELESEGQYVHGICLCLVEILSVLEFRIVTDNKTRIFAMVEKLAEDDEPELRLSVAGILSSIMVKDLDNEFQRKVAKDFCNKLLAFEQSGEEEKASHLQDTIRLIIIQRTKFGDDVIHIFSEEPITPMKVSTFTTMMPYLVTVWFSVYRAKKLLDILFRSSLIEGKIHESVVSCFNRATDLMVEDDREKWTGLWLEYVTDNENKMMRVRTYLKVVIHMFKEVKEESYVKFSKELYDFVVNFISLEEKDIAMLVTEAIDAITNSQQKENQHEFVARLKQQIATCSKGLQKYLLPIFNQEKALDYLLPLIQNTLMHASVERRIDAAIAYKYVIEFTSQANLKSYAAKITGSLIRVVNDKFSYLLKQELFEATCALMKISGKDIRAFLSPLQTTLMKAINDPEFSAVLRPIIMKNVAELLKLNPKADNLRTELLAALDSPAIQVHGTALGVLSMLGQIHGPTMKPEIRAQVLSQLGAFSVKYNSLTDPDIISSLGFALALFSHTNQEANTALDFPQKRYGAKPEIHCIFNFSMLFAPFGNTEGENKLLPALKEKLRILDPIVMERLSSYSKIFIGGLNQISKQELFGLMEEWVVRLDGAGWAVCEKVLSSLPLSECELLGEKSENYKKLKCTVLKYIAKESLKSVLEGVRDIIKNMFNQFANLKEEIIKMETEKAIDHAVAERILTFI